MQGPCEHCSNPDKAKYPCRYSWYLPYREDWKRSGADAPCYGDEYSDSLCRADRSFNSKVLILLTVLVIVLAACWRFAP